jgi:hypothetical protein
LEVTGREDWIDWDEFFRGGKLAERAARWGLRREILLEGDEPIVLFAEV